MKISTNGIETYFEISGEGDKPWVVLSHSLACRLEMWEFQLPALTERYRVLTYDVRGHGKTDAPAMPYSLEMFSDDLNALLAALDIDRCHFVGLSMGGMIGQVNALRPGCRLRSLVLADTTGRWPENMLPMWRERIRSAEADGMVPFAGPAVDRWFTPPFHREHPDLVEKVYGWIVGTPVAGFVGASHGIPKVDTLDRLKQIDIPTLVIVGADDPGTPPEMAHQLHDAIPGSQFYELPAASHLCNMERPELFNTALLNFFERVES